LGYISWPRTCTSAVNNVSNLFWHRICRFPWMRCNKFCLKFIKCTWLGSSVGRTSISFFLIAMRCYCKRMRFLIKLVLYHGERHSYWLLVYSIVTREKIFHWFKED
jgi:hypothetical protein